MEIAVPQKARLLINALESQGYEAYVVGGCVRDSLLGREPHDWDICTSALPQQTRQCAQGAGFATFDTGIAHGTITVHVDHEPFEVTTYRSDGTYSDGRHPDGVTFLSNIKGDLLRRDFTVNAMAYSPSKGLVDVTGGASDLQAGILRAVGNAHERFCEDALRILRGLRFASTYGLSLEAGTAQAIHDDAHLLANVSRERISSELLRLLCGDCVKEILLEYRDVIAVVLPQVEPMFDHGQLNPYHDSDVWEHCVRACALTPPDPILRLVGLIHDVGKPSCFFVDEQGVGHFYGHAKAGESVAREICHSLRLSNDQTDDVCALVREHDRPGLDAPKPVRRMLVKMGERRMRMLLDVMQADLLAHSPYGRQENMAALQHTRDLLEQVLEDMDAFSVRDLKVNGSDLMALGMEPGPALGAMLQELFEAVTDGQLPNQRGALLEYVVAALA